MEITASNKQQGFRSRRGGGERGGGKSAAEGLSWTQARELRIGWIER